MKIDGINEVSSISKSEVHATICSRFNKYEETSIFLIVDKVINKLPAVNIDVNSFQIPCNLKLADPTFHVPGPIDLIIGSEIFWKLLCIGQIQVGKSKPTFQKTKLGWIVSGNVSPIITANKAAYCNLAYQTTLQKQLEKFWLLEEFQKKYNLTAEEQKCEDHFNETHKRQRWKIRRTSSIERQLQGARRLL